MEREPHTREPARQHADHSSLQEHQTTSYDKVYIRCCRPRYSGMTLRLDVGDRRSSARLTGAVQTISSDTERVSYDIVCCSGCQAFDCQVHARGNGVCIHLSCTGDQRRKQWSDVVFRLQLLEMRRHPFFLEGDRYHPPVLVVPNRAVRDGGVATILRLTVYTALLHLGKYSEGLAHRQTLSSHHHAYSYSISWVYKVQHMTLHISAALLRCALVRRMHARPFRAGWIRYLVARHLSAAAGHRGSGTATSL